METIKLDFLPDLLQYAKRADELESDRFLKEILKRLNGQLTEISKVRELERPLYLEYTNYRTTALKEAFVKSLTEEEQQKLQNRNYALKVKVVQLKGNYMPDYGVLYIYEVCPKSLLNLIFFQDEGHLNLDNLIRVKSDEHLIELYKNLFSAQNTKLTNLYKEWLKGN
jgi:hypothetical protein